MSLKDHILKLCQQYASGGRVGYDDGGSVTNPAGEVARELAAGVIPRDWRKVQRNRALAGQEPTPYEQTRIDELNSLLPEYRAARSREIDEAGVGRSIGNGVMNVLPPIPGVNWDERLGAHDAKIQAENRRLADEGSSQFGNWLRTDVPDAAISMALPFAGKAISAFPRTAGVLGGAFAFPAMAGENPEQVKERQAMLRSAGFYDGPIDGVDGMATRAAQQKFDASRAGREKREIERLQAEGIAKQADAQLAETERKRKGEEAATERRRAGEERLQQAEKDVSWYNRALRDYGPTAGYVMGAIAGMGSRAGTKTASDKLSAAAAERANKLMRSPEKLDLPERVANVNQFWSEGQNVPLRGSRSLPFEPQPGTTPGFKSNPDAMPSGDLYLPSRAKNMGTDLGVAGLYGAESLYAQEKMHPDAMRELEAARAAVREDPSESNIGRLQAALNQSATTEFLTNFGRAGALSHMGSGLKMQRTPSRPNIAQGEAERIRVDDLLARKYGPKPETPASPTPLTPQPSKALPPPELPSLPPPAAERMSLPPAPTAPPSTPTIPAKVDASSAPRLSGPLKGYSETPYGYRHDATQRWAGWNPKPEKAPQSKPKAPQSKKPDASEDTGKPLTKGKQGDQDPAAEYFADPTKLTRGQKSGGAVLDKARQYANGGVVAPGLLRGETGGRADALDVDVPNGAYIVPSDAVSGIEGAGNNTEAGWKIWQELLPPTKGMAAGGKVGIMISHGEGVVYPDQIEAIGGGDVKQGHRILDQMVKKVRANNIKHLSKLPSPAKS